MAVMKVLIGVWLLNSLIELKINSSEIKLLKNNLRWSQLDLHYLLLQPPFTIICCVLFVTLPNINIQDQIKGMHVIDFLTMYIKLIIYASPEGQYFWCVLCVLKYIASAHLSVRKANSKRAEITDRFNPTGNSSCCSILFYLKQNLTLNLFKCWFDFG